MKRKLQLLVALALTLTCSLAKADTEETDPRYRKCRDNASNICYQVMNNKGEVVETVKGMPYTTNL